VKVPHAATQRVVVQTEHKPRGGNFSLPLSILIEFVLLYCDSLSAVVFPVSHTERLERVAPALSVETEVNGDSKNTNERVLLWLVRWACRLDTKDH